MTTKIVTKQDLNSEEILAVLEKANCAIIDGLSYLDLLVGVDPKGTTLKRYNLVRKQIRQSEDLIYLARRNLSSAT